MKKRFTEKNAGYGNIPLQDSLSRLSQREWMVLLLLADGFCTDIVAEILCVTVKSVHNYKNRIAQKLSLEGYGAVDSFARKYHDVFYTWSPLLRREVNRLVMARKMDNLDMERTSGGAGVVEVSFDSACLLTKNYG